MSEYRNILKTINRNNNVINWTIKNKLIDISRNIECPITYSAFNVNCYYCVCKYNFDIDALKESFEISDRKTCPMCRSVWKNFTIYVNNKDIVLDEINKHLSTIDDNIIFTNKNDIYLKKLYKYLLTLRNIIF